MDLGQLPTSVKFLIWGVLDELAAAELVTVTDPRNKPTRPTPDCVAVPGFAVLVDVQDARAGDASGDGQVPAGATAEPTGDLLLIDGGVAEAVRGGGIRSCRLDA